MDLDKDVLQAALARAITEAVTPEVQKEVFARAMTNFLFNAARGGESPISEAFQRALREATAELAKEVVKANQPAITAVMQKSFEEFLNNPSTSDKLTTLFAHGFPRY